VNGKISKFLSFRGYGFIKSKEYEKDIFFHLSNYPPRQIPIQNQLVEFDIKETAKGLEAVNIKILHELPKEDSIQEAKDNAVEKSSSKEKELNVSIVD
jgi:cold shock CspA family protein